MKSRQLANVLVKILGLSIFIHAIPGCVTGIVWALSSAFGVSKTEAALWTFSSAIGSVVQFIVAIIIITASQTIVGWMFKDSDE